jgi:hypothetical protein
MSTITIPGAVVPYIRGGAQLQIAGAAEQLATVIGEAMHSGVAPLGERQRLLRAWALVDLLGWLDETSGPVELEVHEHREGLLGALRGNADRLARSVGDEPDDPQRATREDDLQALREFESAALQAIESEQRTTVAATMPGEVVELLRGGLYAELERACEDVPSTEPKIRASWAGVLRRIEQARRALDVIGWASPSEQQPLTLAIDAVMIEALERDAAGWEWASEQQTIESAEGRARAAAHAAAIERFLGGLAERPTATTLLIPVSAFGLVREGVLDCVTDVSSAIDSTHAWRRCSRDLSDLCELLDLIGWESDSERESDVDASGQAGALAKATEAMLPVLTRAAADADGDAEQATVEGQLELMGELYASASRAVGELAW